MRRLPLALILPVLFCACIAEAVEVRDLEGTFKVEPGKTVRIDISVAEIEIEAADRADVAIELTVRCRWSLSECEDAIEDMEIASRSSSRRLTLEVTGQKRWHSSMMELEGTILVPRSSPLEVKMGVADLDITGVEKDMRVDLGVGRVRVRAPEEKLGEVFIDVGVGQVKLSGPNARLDGRRSFLVGTEVHWNEGAGKAEFDIEVGVGEVTVRLE